MKRIIYFLLFGISLLLFPQTVCAVEDPDWAYDYLDSLEMRADVPMTIAAEVLPREDGMYYVTDFGADGTDTADDAQAFVKALAKAKDAAAPVTVYIPAGTYYIDRSLPVYSNTNLIADGGATMIATFAEGSFVFGRHLDEQGNICGHETCTHGGYTQVVNVTIQGGTWDRNCTPDGGVNAIFKIRHGYNIAIKNLVCKNATSHYINLSGVSTALVENVQCLDRVAYTGSDPSFWGSRAVGDSERYESIEAIHLDYIAGGESSAYPVDGTAPANVTVQNCLFQNMFAGVGTHHRAKGAHGSFIIIKNNTFNNIMANCVNAYDFDASTISGNTVTNARKIVYSLGGNNNTIENNTINSTSGIAVHIDSNPTVNVIGNSITGSKKKGIYITGSGNCSITGNKVTDSQGHGIQVVGSAALACKAVISGNESVSSAASERDIVLGSYCIGSVIENNHIGIRGLKLDDTASYQLLNNRFDPHEHKGISWTLTKEATALAVGQEKSNCDICRIEMVREVAKLPPTMTLSDAVVSVEAKKTYNVTVSGLAKADSVKSWRSSNNKVAAVNKAGKITGKKKGTATITVTLASGLERSITVNVQPHVHVFGKWTTLKAATALTAGKERRTCKVCNKVQNRKIAKLKATIKLPASSIPLKVGQSYKITVSNLAKGDKVKQWKSSRPNIVAVGKNGKITGRRVGSATITVTLKSGLKRQITVKVQNTAVETKKIVLNHTEYTLEKGKRFKLEAAVRPVSSRQKVIFKSLDKNVVKVSGNGSVLGVSRGTAMVVVISGRRTVGCRVNVR